MNDAPVICKHTVRELRDGMEAVEGKVRTYLQFHRQTLEPIVAQLRDTIILAANAGLDEASTCARSNRRTCGGSTSSCLPRRAAGPLSSHPLSHCCACWQSKAAPRAPIIAYAQTRRLIGSWSKSSLSLLYLTIRTF